MGVFPSSVKSGLRKISLPHARGGVSVLLFTKRGWRASSPRTWGCFLSCPCAIFRALVFPTHVGVFLIMGLDFRLFDGLPHARGGVSYPRYSIQTTGPSSPRTWGCFYLYTIKLVSLKVFPTHVGVFPLFREFIGYPFRLPHARGGVSESSILNC